MDKNYINKSFIKDFKIPIAVHQEPYFSYLLDLLDPYYDCKAKYKMYLDDIGQDASSFFERNRELMHSTIKYLNEKKEMEVFNSFDMSKFKKTISVSGRELYKPENAGKKFISIDLVKANFQSLYIIVPELFDGFNNFNDFALSRGFNQTLLNSKITRQVIFGNLNAKRQQQIQKFMMSNIVDKLIKDFVKPDHIYSLSSDEVFFEVHDNIDVKYVNESLLPLNYDLRIEQFILNKPFENSFFVKEYGENKVEFKMIPSSVMAEFIKKYEKREVEDMDLYFYDENKRLSRFVESYIK